MKIIPIAQLIVSILIIILILLQEKSSGLSSTFGGSSGEGNIYQTRRGLEKIVFIGTIILAALFAALSLIDLIY